MSGSAKDPQTRSPIICFANKRSISFGADFLSNHGIMSVSRSFFIILTILSSSISVSCSDCFLGNSPFSSFFTKSLEISASPTSLSRANGGVVAIRSIIMESGTDFNILTESEFKQSVL